jgi:hypothetical protein
MSYHSSYALYPSSIMHVIGDEAHGEVVVEEPQEVEVVDEPPKVAQGRPICFTNA